jgi:hypothetical protein
MITIDCVLNAVAICTWHLLVYDTIFIYITVLEYMLMGLVVIAAFRGITEAFPRVGYSVTLLFGALTVVGACSVWMARFYTAAQVWSVFWALALVGKRDVAFIMATTLAGARITIAIMGVPTRQSARRFCDLTTLYMFGPFLSAAFALIHLRPYYVLSTLLSTCNDIIFAGLSAFWLFRPSDREEDLLPLAWCHALDRPKTELLQLEGREEISRLLGPDVEQGNEESSRGASCAKA